MPFSGVDEQSFVLLFAICAVIAAAVAQLWRILALTHSTPRGSIPVGQASVISLTPVEAAYLSGGCRSAFTVAVAELRSTQLTTRPDDLQAAPADQWQAGYGQADLEQGAPLGPVEAAILQLDDSTVAVRRADVDRQLRQAYSILAADLQQRGLLLTRRQRVWIGMAGLPLAIVTGSGILRLAYRPDYSLLSAVLAGGLILSGLLLRVPRGTPFGMTLAETPQAAVTTGRDQLWDWQSTLLHNPSLAG
jgi:uncharacterized protein (TIGR04222 family)